MRNKRKILVFTLTLLFLVSVNFVLALAEGNTEGSYGWGFKPGQKGEKPDVGFYGAIIEKHNAVYVDKTTDKRIYLTFDAGYETGLMCSILDILKKQNVFATFFLVGDYLKGNEAIVKRMVNEGHIVGNHTWKHPDLTKISRERYEAELKKFEEKYKEITGQSSLKILRPPAGTFSHKSLQIADDLGYHTVFWSLAYKDWERDKTRGWEYSYNNVMNRIHPGAIILMHTVSRDNVEALEKIIIDLRAEGYEFNSIVDLIKQTA